MTRSYRRCILAIAVFATTSTAFAANFQLLNLDDPGEGFNDPTPVAPVGNNTGVTLGEQRVQAFEFAMALWGAIIESDVTIVVAADFSPAECFALGGVLGFAGPNDVFADFPGAPLADTWYVSALADRLAGFDQAPGEPDILVTINSTIDETDDCLPEVWYYGFDGSPPPGTLDVVETILHELAHGLGFLSIADQQGQFPDGNTPDIYSRQLFDLEFGETWPNLTSVQRQTSSINDPDLVWIGEAVTARFPDFLDTAPALIVESPAAIAGVYDAQSASFGPPIPENGISGRVALVNDGVDVLTDGCSPLIEFPAGSIALIDRGECFFTEKVAFAQAAGAAGVIIANNVSGGLPPLGGEDDGSITIPTLGVTIQTGQLLKDNLGASILVTFGRDPNSFAGENGGFLRMHAPAPFEGGSSVSHWTSDAMPDLLMEPTAGFLEPFMVDMTIPAFQDIGWTRSPVFTTSPPLVVQEDVDYSYTARIDDPDVNDTLQLVEVTLPDFLQVISRQQNALTISGTPSPDDAGTHRVVLRATDRFGNATLQDFTIRVQGVNDEPEFVSEPVTIAEPGQEYVYMIEVIDVDPGDIVSISATVLPDWLNFMNISQGHAQLAGTPTTGDLGPHPVTLRAIDTQSAVVLQQFTITVADQPPVITLNGAAAITIQCRSVFSDPGATAVDTIDGEVDVNVDCTVDTTTPGMHICTYTAEDSVGNVATVTRTVEVVDTELPTVTLSGPASITLALGDTFDDPGATATDACAGELDVDVGGDIVDTAIEGEYVVVYSATDPSGNTAQVSRRVTVIADFPPAITLNGSAAVTAECGEAFNDPGAIADDPEDGALLPVIMCNVDTGVPGDYTCTYTVTDSAGNTATVQRMVTVVDTEPPVITLNGDATMELEQGMPYTEAGATANDACGGDTAVMIGGDLVNSNLIGTYEVEFRAVDAAGNEATATRTVVIEEPATQTGCAAGPGASRKNSGDVAVFAAAVLALATLRRRTAQRSR